MKKILSLVLSIMMITACFAVPSISYAEDANSCPKGGQHEMELLLKKANFEEGGYQYAECKKCHYRPDEIAGPYPHVEVEVEAAAYEYDGKAKEPKVRVYNADGDLLKEYYKVEYINNINPGTAKVVITLLGDYYEGTKTVEFPIVEGKIPYNPQSANTLIAKGKKVTLKAKTLKKKKKVVIKRKKAITVKNAKGKVTYKKASKGYKKITVNKKNGKITVKKGLKKGTYKVKIKVTAAGNNNYAPITKKVTVTIVVK